MDYPLLDAGYNYDKEISDVLFANNKRGSKERIFTASYESDLVVKE